MSSLNKTMKIGLFGLTVLIAAPINAVERVALDGIAAVVNNNIISRLELKQELENIVTQLRRQGRQLPAGSDLSRQVLQKMIDMDLQLQIAKRRSIRVDDDEVNLYIENVARQNKMDLIQFSQALKSEGIDFENYRDRIRKEMVIAQLQRMLVLNRISITEDEIDRFLANQALRSNNNDEFHLGHILVAIPEAATSEQISKAREKAEKIKQDINSGKNFEQMAITRSDGQQALNGGDLGWRKLAQLPTLFSDLVVDMKLGEVSNAIKSPSGFHIIKLINKRRNEKQHIVLQSKVRHILIKPNLFLSVKEAKVRAEQIKQRLEGGESFKKLALAHSDDKGSGIDGGDLGWVNPGTMAKPFEAAMNRLDLKSYSEPVRTQFGWHIIQVLDRRKQDNTEEFRRNQARAALRERKLQPAEVNWIRRIRDEAFIEVRL